MEKTTENLLSRRVSEIIEKDNLEKALNSGKKLRVKFGIDPTGPNIHLGHAVVLRKLKEFQDAGHKIILIIGDFTARIGDPSGRSETRKPLSEKEVKNNMKEYLKETGRILNIKKCDVKYNSSWFEKELLAEAIRLTAASTIQQVLHRSDFKKRIEEDNDITLTEILYPVLQGYDSVKIMADLELGGTDQKFNLLMGRRVQRYFKQKEQDVMMCPILEGLDGVKKMSKSYENHIALSESGENMFGKTMSLPDSLIEKYFNLCTDLDSEEIKSILNNPPRNAKLKLAWEIVSLYHGEKEADEAREKFIRVFSKREVPEEIPEIDNLGSLIATTAAALAKSNSEAKRLIEQGAVEISGKKVSLNDNYKKGDIIKIGKKQFFKIK